jgi:hypothetical protein
LLDDAAWAASMHIAFRKMHAPDSWCIK